LITGGRVGQAACADRAPGTLHPPLRALPARWVRRAWYAEVETTRLGCRLVPSAPRRRSAATARGSWRRACSDGRLVCGIRRCITRLASSWPAPHAARRRRLVLRPCGAPPSPPAGSRDRKEIDGDGGFGSLRLEAPARQASRELLGPAPI
jgi:hypothetical protein